eukprot:SAG31_NODE_33148_length_347_cov_0.822581_2_plen_28_part_01
MLGARSILGAAALLLGGRAAQAGELSGE